MRYRYSGIADEMLRFVEKEQLKDRTLWELVTEVYASCPDDVDLGWRGEYWGKLMRGACMTWQYTADEALYGILSEAVEKLMACQEADGRLSTYSRDKEFQGWDMWCRKYVLMGFVYFYEICRDAAQRERVLLSACRHLDYIIQRVGDGDGKKRITETSNIWRGINSSSILEPVVKIYRICGNAGYLDFASYIVKEGGAAGFDIFQAAYEDRRYPYEYPVVKAYELMSCFEGLAEYAEVTGDAKWRTAVIRFADKLLESEATITGGSGCRHELFNHSSAAQTDAEYNGLMLETCVTVTWMKLMHKVYLMTGESRYLDELEKSAFNALYGAVNTENSVCGAETVFDEPEYRQVYDNYIADRGGKGQIFDSYSPLHADIRGRAVGGFKSMRDGTAFCGCCIAIGAAGTALVPAASARTTATGIEIGLYLPGTIRTDLRLPGWTSARQVEIRIDTLYPQDGNITCTITDITDMTDAANHGEAEFEIGLRIPAFAGNSLISVNGKPVKAAATGGFCRICRRWRASDVIKLCLDMHPRLVYVMETGEFSGELPLGVAGKLPRAGKFPQGRGYAAVCVGPLVLARDRRLGTVGESFSYGGGKLEAKRCERQRIPFPCQCAYEVRLGGKRHLMIDYASAGKSWGRDSELEVWMAFYSEEAAFGE
ncbi:MAG: hypothetical protein HDR26_00395 [Lachnospiraceae bacterium]|nr:hypothetical protein [Lachnospiraceae bacterium]